MEQLDSIRQFNAEIIAIAKTGLPIDLKMGETRATLEHILHESANRIAEAVRAGMPLETAISEDQHLSDVYRNALNARLYGDLAATSLDSFAEPASVRGRKRNTIQLALVQPLILVAIAYVAMIFLCSVTLRSYMRLDAQFHEQGNWSIAILSGIANAMWIWVPLIPVLMILIIVRFYVFNAIRTQSGMRSSGAANRGVKGSEDWIEQAEYADRVAGYVENQIPLDDAYRLAGGSGVIATTSSCEHSDRLQALELSPLMRWATAESRSSEAKVSALRFVARTYRQYATLRTQRTRKWFRILATVGIGGVIVLGVAISVFAPPVEFLLRIAQGDR